MIHTTFIKLKLHRHKEPDPAKESGSILKIFIALLPLGEKRQFNTPFNLKGIIRI